MKYIYRILLFYFVGVCANTYAESVKTTSDGVEYVKGPDLSGVYVPEFQSFDKIISGAMLAWSISGGSVAVAKDGKILYARGFGVADSNGKKVMPESLFRIASVSKIITGMTILYLCEKGQLKLSDKIVDLLKDKIKQSDVVDDRWKSITVENLLYHNSGVPQFEGWAKKSADISSDKTTPTEILQYLIKQKLEFTPGSQCIYNNQNFLILGRIIEVVTKTKYEEYVKKELLYPLGIENMEIGKSDKSQRYPKEVEYGIGQKLPKTYSVTSKEKELIEAPYSICIESMDSFGGWIASAVDIVRFVTYFDGFDHPKDIIGNSLWQKMVYKPEFPYIKQETNPWQGMSWLVRKNGDGFNYWHCGSLWGTKSEVVRTADGYVWCWIFNGETNQNDIDQFMWAAKDQISLMPNRDLTKELFPNAKRY